MGNRALRNLAWPLIGRVEELQRICGLLGSQKAAVLVGPAGVGKTRLATDCLRIAADRQFVPLRVTATRAIGRLPFGAFAPLLPAFPEATDEARALLHIANSIKKRGEGRPIAIFVDDAHLLDDLSAALTHLLATMDGVFVLVAVRSDEPVSDALTALWKDELAQRLDLKPLTQAETQELLSVALQGPVDPATSRILWDRTEGNPLFLRELVMAAMEARSLHNESGIWRIHETLPISARLIEIVEARIGAIPESARHALELLALAEPMSVHVLTRLSSATDLENLERRGLVYVERKNRRLDARFAHPLYGEVVRSRLSPLRAIATARAVGDALESTGARRREDALQIATLRLDGGGPTNPERMLRAANIARERFDFRLAERLARAAVESGAGFEASLLLGHLLWLQGRPEDAERYLGGIADQAATDRQRAMLAGTRMTVLYVGLGRPVEALEVLDKAEATISDLSLRDQITTERARLLSRTGQYASAVSLIEPLLDRTKGQAQVAACMAAANAMAITGRIDAALEATKRGYAAHLELGGVPVPFGPYFHLVLRFHALLLAGRIAEARALALKEYEKGVEQGSPESQAMFSMCLGVADLATGRVDASARFSQEAAALLREMKWAIFVLMSLSAFAHAVALQGRPEKAREALAEVRALGIPTSEFYGSEVLRAQAWTDVARGDLVKARKVLEEAAAVARAGGGSAFESAALHDLARLGHAATVAPRLAELAQVIEGKLATARSKHALALEAKNPAGLESASVAFEEIDAILLAAEASADAAVAWRRSGESRKAAAAGRRAEQLMLRCEGARTPTLTTTVSARAALTPRELEIARLASRGLSNRNIAERLFLSHRTVENQLHSAYLKLGVTSRAQLAEALEGD